MARVPLPHMGLTKLPSPCQPVASTTAAGQRFLHRRRKRDLPVAAAGKRFPRRVEVYGCSALSFQLEMHHAPAAFGAGIGPRPALSP